MRVMIYMIVNTAGEVVLERAFKCEGDADKVCHAIVVGQTEKFGIALPTVNEEIFVKGYFLS